MTSKSDDEVEFRSIEEMMREDMLKFLGVALWTLVLLGFFVVGLTMV